MKLFDKKTKEVTYMEGFMNENPMTSLVIPRPKIKSMTRFCIGSSDFST